MNKLFGKLDEDDVKVLIKLLKQAEASPPVTQQQLPSLEHLQVDLKLDGPATYLSWSRQITGALAGSGLEGYLTGEEEEPSDRKTAEWKTWRATHMSLYTWLLNSMVQLIASTVDSIQSVKDIWTKLQRTYVWEGNNMRVLQIEEEIDDVFQGDRMIKEYAMPELQRTYAEKGNNMRLFSIKQEIDVVFQGDRTIHDYAIELERLWTDYDHFSPVTVCKDPECKSREVFAQRRTMQFLKHLNPAFDQRRAILLAQTKIPTLDEAIAIMMQEESRMKLFSDATGLPRMRSALAALNPNPSRSYGETRKCYNCGEVGHLSRACPKLPREREAGRRGQPGGRGYGRGGCRGGRGGSY